MSKLKFFVFLLVVGFGDCDEKYTSKYDSIDYQSILQSERLLKNYYNCLMDQGACTAEGKELKNLLPDALQTDCMKCTEKQKHGGKEIIDFMIKNKHDWWKNLETKFDPDGIYKEKYKDDWLKLGYTL